MAEEGNNNLFLLSIVVSRANQRRFATTDRDASVKHVKQQTTTENEAGSGGIIGTVKSYLGFDDNTASSVQDAATSVSTAAAQVADTYLPESVKPEAVKGAANTEAGDTKDDSAAVDPSTDKSESKADQDAPAEDPSTDKSEDKADNKDTGDKKGPVGAARENPDAIPTAGGQKVGAEHWGESKIVPDNPKPEAQAEGEASGVASAEGQPTEEVKNNTSANVGSATSGPPQPAPSAAAHTDSAAAETSSPARSNTTTTTDSDKKPKLMDRLKSKFKKDKS